MIINRSHFPWFIGVVVATAVAALLYTSNFYPGQYTHFSLPKVFGPTPPVVKTVGGTPLGLIFGTIAYLCFLIAAGLGIRKKRRLLPIGHVQLWMKMHIWLTTLTVPLVLFHSGFSFGGFWTSALMVLYIIVMASGYFGLGLQQYMPGYIARRIPQEAVFEAIPHVRAELMQAAEKFWRELAPDMHRGTSPLSEAAEAHGQPGGHAVTALVAPSTETEAEVASRRSIAHFMQEHVFPYLRAEKGGRLRMANPLFAESSFRALRLNCTEKWAPQIRLMEQWCYDRRNLDLQVHLHHWLHGWLLVHVPLSFILLAYTLWHAIVLVSYL